MVKEPSDSTSSEESTGSEALIFAFEIVNCMTAFEPSEIARLAKSPVSINPTAAWISRDVTAKSGLQNVVDVIANHTNHVLAI